MKEFIDKDICDGVKTCADGRYYKKAETLNRTCSDCNCDPITCNCNGVVITDGAESTTEDKKSCSDCAKKEAETTTDIVASKAIVAPAALPLFAY